MIYPSFSYSLPGGSCDVFLFLSPVFLLYCFPLSRISPLFIHYECNIELWSPRGRVSRVVPFVVLGIMSAISQVNGMATSPICLFHPLIRKRDLNEGLFAEQLEILVR